MYQRLDQLVDQAERIGVIGSPSSTSELALDILASAIHKKLIGELAIFRYMQDGVPHYALGQITEIKLRNVWHEDPTMRSLIRQRGRIDTVSERQDTHLGEMTISAVFAARSGTYRPDMLGTVPPTGTPIYLVTDAILHELLALFKQQLFYLGHIYGSTPLLPCWFKHFGSGLDGAGEAYHLGIFGKTGSGKSVLAKMILLAYARHREMGLLVIDPQGEFAKDMRDHTGTGSFRLPMQSILQKLGRNVQVIGIRNLVLDRWDLFEQILGNSGFFQRLGIKASQNQKQAAEVVREHLEGKKKLTDLHLRETFDSVWEILKKEQNLTRIYGTKDKRDQVLTQMHRLVPDTIYRQAWLPITQLFHQRRQEAQTVDHLLENLFTGQGQRAVVVIDLSEEQSLASKPTSKNQLTLPGVAEIDDTALPSGIVWNDTIQALVMRRLLEGIRHAAERSYRQNRSLNTLVLIDEAHRIAPREEPSNEEQQAVRTFLIDAVRTTRKYGVGWMFISQTLSSLHREIIEQLRIFFFGFGLSMGTEFRALSELVGGRGNALDLYQLFRDPHSAIDSDSREYSFMTIGPVSPLSFAGTPLFLNAFNNVTDFLKQNNLQ
ncbi:MAG: ATPase [Chloroflexus aggregans]|uniref:ATPase n=1 Tax=Chloroflexus aggregans TaxID=152260 RepID=A0A2J6X6K4_9CHLR|nr:MAG: ATPase [Chloroflexus aggregans]